MEKLLKLLQPLSIVEPNRMYEPTVSVNVKLMRMLMNASRTQENLMPIAKDLIVNLKSKLMPCQKWGSTRPCLSTPS